MRIVFDHFGHELDLKKVLAPECLSGQVSCIGEPDREWRLQGFVVDAWSRLGVRPGDEPADDVEPPAVLVVTRRYLTDVEDPSLGCRLG